MRHVIVLVMVVGILFVSATTVQAVPLFTQCPAVGFADGCSALFTITNTGVTFAVDPAIRAYDGDEDTLIGIQNNSSTTRTSLPVTSASTTIFGFDGDGAGLPGTGCLAASNPPHPCLSGGPFGSTGYEGPGTSFSNISQDQRSATVNFTLAPGGSAWFSLEGSPAAVATGVGGAVPEPASLGLMLTGVLWLLYRRRFANR
jgi:hypothetical protein